MQKGIENNEIKDIHRDKMSYKLTNGFKWFYLLYEKKGPLLCQSLFR
jgi:hypothetical protein